MSTTLPSDSAAQADELPSWTLHLSAADWSALVRQIKKKRSLAKLVKRQLPEQQPLLWALPENLALETKPLVQRLQALTAAALATTVGPNAKQQLKPNQKLKKQKKSQKSKKGSLGKSSAQAKSKHKQESKLAAAKTVLDSKTVALLRQWLDEIGQRPADVSSALEALAWSRALPLLSQHLEESVWSELFEALRNMAYTAGRMPFGQMPLSRQLLAAELPVTLASSFDDFQSDTLGALGAEGLGCLLDGMRELLDGEGMIHASSLTHQRSLLACWARTLRLAHDTSLEPHDDALSQFEWVLRQSIRFTRHDGQQILNGGRSGQWDDAFMETAVGLDSDPVDRRAAMLLPWSHTPRLKSKCKLTELPLPGFYSEWSECGVLAAGWSPFDAKVGVALPSRKVMCEWNAAARTWFDGQWSFQIEVNGVQLAQTADVEQICWHQDEDVDYLELQMMFENDWVVQRQLLLDRRHQFVFAADAVLGQRPDQIRCRATLPLAGSVKPTAEKETRELTLKSRKTTIDVLPLALPEWRSERAAGELVGDAEQITLTQHAVGKSLYMPLFIHLNPNRDRQLTWRHLTVAEELQIQPPSVAAGYRVQFGEFQWLFYRSLGQVVPRTVLGQHLNCEFFAGRFLPDGQTEELVAIEGPENESAG